MADNKIKNGNAAASAGFISAAIKAMLVGVGTAFALSLVMSGVALSREDPDSIIGVLAYVCLFMGALVCGITGVRCDTERSLLSPLLGGAMYVLVLWIISIFFRAGAEAPVAPVMLILGYVGCIALSMIGGLIGKGRTKSIGGGKKSPTALMRKQLGRR